jgi:amidase
MYKQSACQMVAKLKAGDISPSEAVHAAFARIEAVEPQVHAMPTLCKDRALAAAAAIENDATRQRERRDDPAWLAGLPVAIKDLSDVEGVRTTYGSPIFADHVPDASDLLVERLEHNGAIVIGKSNTPEFGAGGNSFNEVFPATVTPWDTRMTAGGSSGGAASALAAGEVWLATGSDLGGSLRTPASFCGIVGLRPSPGRIASGPSPLPFDTMAVHGPMARTVADAALFLDAMVGRDGRDPISMETPSVPFLSATLEPPRKRRVAYSPDLGVSPVDPEVARICENAVNRLAAMGWDVTDEVPDFSGVMDIFQTLRGASFAAGMDDLYTNHKDLLKPEIIWNIEKGQQQTTANVGKAERDRGAFYHVMTTFYENHDLLICPTACTPPFPVETRYLDALGDVKFSTYMDWLSLPSVITVSASPVISLPCGTTETGLPVGLQMAGPWSREFDLIAAAHEAEQALGMAGTVPMDPVSR